LLLSPSNLIHLLSASEKLRESEVGKSTLAGTLAAGLSFLFSRALTGDNHVLCLVAAQEEIKGLGSQLTDSKRTIETLNASNATKDGNITTLNQTLTTLRQDVASKDATITEVKRQLDAEKAERERVAGQVCFAVSALFLFLTILL
jgi:septal ring factor EnvC (AmiA/AmiB activator)